MKVLSKKKIGALVALGVTMGLIVGTGSAVADTATTPKLTIAEKAARKAAAELHKAAVVQYKVQSRAIDHQQILLVQHLKLHTNQLRQLVMQQ
jgi:hypothetical protein